MIDTNDDTRACSGASGDANAHRVLQSRLADAILTGELAPAARLDDARLAAAFGAARPEVRRALDGLAAAGLIAVRRDGTRSVTVLDGDRARDVVAMFGDVWIGSVRHAMSLLHADDVAYLQELMDDVTLAVGARDVAAFAAAVRVFAVAFARIEGNTERAELLASLGALLGCITRRAGGSFDWSDVSAAVARIAAVLPDRDAAAMRAALIALFDDVLPSIVDHAVAQARPLAAA